MLLARCELVGGGMITLAFSANHGGTDQAFPERVIIAARRRIAVKPETPGRFLLAHKQREYERNRRKCSPHAHGSHLLSLGRLSPT